MAESIGPKFCVGPHMTSGKDYRCLKLQKMCPKVLDFCKILKIREQILSNPRTFLLFLYCTKRVCLQRDPRPTTKSYNWRWDTSFPSFSSFPFFPLCSLCFPIFPICGFFLVCWFILPHSFFSKYHLTLTFTNIPPCYFKEACTAWSHCTASINEHY